MAKENVRLKDRIAAGLAYWSGWLAALISLFYFKDRRGFTYYHCVQGLVFTTVLQLALFAAIWASPQFRAVVIEQGPSGGIVWWIIIIIFAVLFIAAASGRRFRIPFVCNIADWILKSFDNLITKSEKAKKNKQ